MVRGHVKGLGEGIAVRGATPAKFNLGWPVVVKPVPSGHTSGMEAKPATELSGELTALIQRAELASAQARLLLTENDRWRDTIQQQLNYMFELGAEFRRGRRECLSSED